MCLSVCVCVCVNLGSLVINDFLRFFNALVLLLFMNFCSPCAFCFKKPHLNGEWVVAFS